MFIIESPDPIKEGGFQSKMGSCPGFFLRFFPESVNARPDPH